MLIRKAKSTTLRALDEIKGGERITNFDSETLADLARHLTECLKTGIGAEAAGGERLLAAFAIGEKHKIDFLTSVPFTAAETPAPPRTSLIHFQPERKNAIAPLQHEQPLALRAPQKATQKKASEQKSEIGTAITQAQQRVASTATPAPNAVPATAKIIRTRASRRDLTSENIAHLKIHE